MSELTNQFEERISQTCHGIDLTGDHWDRIYSFLRFHTEVIGRNPESYMEEITEDIDLRLTFLGFLVSDLLFKSDKDPIDWEMIKLLPGGYRSMRDTTAKHAFVRRYLGCMMDAPEYVQDDINAMWGKGVNLFAA